NRVKGYELKAHRFVELNEENLFDGMDLLGNSQRPQVGDVFVNLRFPHPTMVGNFFSKRGIAHARLIVDVREANGELEIQTLDGGWGTYSHFQKIASQTLWLRPKPEFFEKSDEELLRVFAKSIEPLGYDSTLRDDLAEFRDRLYKSLDSRGMTRENQVTQREKYIRLLLGNGERDNRSIEDIVKGYYQTKGAREQKYCSEAPTDVFALLGFRQFGETVFENLVAFSPDGNIPDWAAYENALGGFDADKGPILLMHKYFYGLFILFDKLTANGILPSLRNPQFVRVLNRKIRDYKRENGVYSEGRSLLDFYKSLNFATRMEIYRNSALDFNYKAPSKNRDAMYDDIQGAYQAALQTGDEKMASEVKQLVDGKDGVVQGLRAQYESLIPFSTKENFTLTDAINLFFFENRAYGPHHFVDNSQMFDLVGVFYTAAEGEDDYAEPAMFEEPERITTNYEINSEEYERLLKEGRSPISEYSKCAGSELD
ncbi:MAG: hypothetical protein KDD25_07350, partial [Bdellovibrionales bacterium]|nr:hypothetical protein [Bdellovibrionales bacterium]